MSKTMKHSLLSIGVQCISSCQRISTSIHRNVSASLHSHCYAVDGNVSLRFTRLACAVQLVVCLSAAYELRNDIIVLFFCVHVLLEFSNVSLVHAVTK